MDFNRFQQWCENKGFVITLPSGYIRVNNLDVKDFNSFKGLFNLCMMFFQEKMNEQRNEEETLAKAKEMKQCLKNWNKQPVVLYKDRDTKPSDWWDSASSPDGDADLGKKNYQRELQNCKSGD